MLDKITILWILLLTLLYLLLVIVLAVPFALFGKDNIYNYNKKKSEEFWTENNEIKSEEFRFEI
jgi:predicted membrane protein